MALMEFLARERAAILERWHRKVLETYPAETARFLGQTGDPFANPVGATLSRELPVLYEALLGSGAPERTAKALDALVKLRSVQDFSPSRAVGFVFLLKAAVLEEMGAASGERGPADEWPALDDRIDSLALSAFDAYAENRERICEIKINAMKKRTFILERVALGLTGSDRGDPGR